MKPTLLFTGHDVLFKDSQGNHSLSPYYFDGAAEMLVGNQVSKALDLYPMSIRNIFDEEGPDTTDAYLRALQRHIANAFAAKDYNVQIDSQLPWLLPCVKRSIPGHTTQLSHCRTRNKLSEPWDKDVRDALSTVIAVTLVQSGKVNPHLYDKLKRIVQLRVDFHLLELMDLGETTVRMKLVDSKGNVQTVNERVGEEIQALKRLVELYRKPSVSNAEIMKALYGMSDEHYKVTFISPFSYGKSTLINSLLGEKLLKMDIRAETAIVTKVVSADINRLYVKYNENRIERYTFDTYEELKEKLAGLTSVRGGEIPQEVQICHTLGRLPCISLIDAPGLNSRHSDHNEKALDAFRISDLVFFLINPGHIGEANFSRQIKEFLSAIQSDGLKKRYGFILSKLDLYVDDYDVIKNELEIVLKTMDPSHMEDRIFFVSGYFGLIGKMLLEGRMELSEVRKSHGVYVIDEDDIISGRALEQYHAKDLLKFSQIERLEQFIQGRGEIARASS
ncbi:dynamin family protein [Paenibacillus sp. GD4]|uniref:dynamin family protein n=1 Tax=Paenibacillus sp. GD4 TaxID=3068890 RepID=UPI00279646C8|nr:dynamin family protein [Paenibacillus sp. GD4]MDQ1908952.1 dynamin family protein [Paenibacillus sp. GD4]